MSRDKIGFFPQWAEPIFKPMGSTEYLLGDIPKDSFKIMFAGNIGESQDFPSILNAAKLLKGNRDIHWIILGSGRREEWVKNKVKSFGLEGCFHMLGSFPLEKMPEFYANADAMLFSLKDDAAFSITIPAKVQTYLACGKPIIASNVPGNRDCIIHGSNGFLVDGNNISSINENLFFLKSTKLRDKFSELSLDIYNKKFSRSNVCPKYLSLFTT